MNDLYNMGHENHSQAQHFYSSQTKFIEFVDEYTDYAEKNPHVVKKFQDMNKSVLSRMGT